MAIVGKLFLFLLAIGFWIYLSPPLIRALYPEKWTLEVKEIKVGDTAYGLSPIVVVDRLPHRTFSPNLITTLRPVTWPGSETGVRSGISDTGTFPPSCVREHYGLNFVKDRPFPKRTVRLAEFQDVPPNPACDLTPGEWKATFRYEWEHWWLPGVRFFVEKDSNTFEVFEADTPPRALLGDR